MAQLKFQKKQRNEHDVFADKVFAAMETGNHTVARTLLKEYEDLYPVESSRLYSVITKEYGVSL